MGDVSGSHVLQGDVLDICSEIEDDYFDAVFCDPPYGLSKTRNKPEKVLRAWLDGEEADAGSGGFMGENWDGVVPGPRIWREIMRTMKPGAHLMAFGGTTTVDYLTIALRLAGFEVRDAFMYFYCYGTGFPKSHNISKALDKKAGAEREVVGKKTYAGGHVQNSSEDKLDPPIGTFKRPQDERIETAPATQAAKRFDGYGTALKPAYEPIVLAMKPRGKSFADCALEHGVAGLNIDGGRIGTEERHNPPAANKGGGSALNMSKEGMPDDVDGQDCQGRFPANLILDEAAGDRLDDQAGDEKSRFFYTAKASKAEREAGLESDGGRANKHPTVKPLDLCRYFATLLLPPEREDNRKILVPFAGSGSEMIGARAAGWEFVAGIEKEEEYCEIAERRLEYWENEEIE